MDISKIKKNQDLIMASIAEEIEMENLFKVKKEELSKNRRLLAIEVCLISNIFLKKSLLYLYSI